MLCQLWPNSSVALALAVRHLSWKRDEQRLVELEEDGPATEPSEHHQLDQIVLGHFYFNKCTDTPWGEEMLLTTLTASDLGENVRKGHF